MVAPSGEQYEFAADGYRAVVTESGAALRLLERDGRPLLDGFAEDEMSSGGRGQLLVPWPNRLRDGRYSFDGRDLQLALTEPARSNASHGLVRWAAWTLEELTGTSVSLVHRLMAQSGYPWTVDLHVLYDLSADGLTVTQTATNVSAAPAPYASGAHPYLRVGGRIDALELTVPASTWLEVDDRLLPIATHAVDDEHDFRTARTIGDAVLDVAMGGLEHRDGRATVTLRDPDDGAGVALWVDDRHHWLQVFSGDTDPDHDRRSLAVEPMTAPPDAFRSGTDLVTLAPAGEAGDELSASWGIRALG
jgi:aldose 1-epimerase